MKLVWLLVAFDESAWRRKEFQQLVDGGGDFPESADRALEKASTLSSSASADTARLVSWIAVADTSSELAGERVEAERARVIRRDCSSF